MIDRPVNIPFVIMALVWAGTLNWGAQNRQQKQRSDHWDLWRQHQAELVGVAVVADTLPYLLCSILEHCCERGLLRHAESARGWRLASEVGRRLVREQLLLTLYRAAWGPTSG